MKVYRIAMKNRAVEITLTVHAAHRGLAEDQARKIHPEMQITSVVEIEDLPQMSG